MTVLGFLLVILGCAALWFSGSISALGQRYKTGIGSWVSMLVCGGAAVLTGLALLVLR